MTIKRVTIVNIIILTVIIISRWIFELHNFTFDTITLSLTLICIGISFIPFVSEVNIFSVFRIAKLDNDIKEIKTHIFKGKVVNLIDDDRDYFIDQDGFYHVLPDIKTRDFLMTLEGPISITKLDLKKYKKGIDYDSVLNARLVLWKKAGGHYFIIMNNKKYHVPSASYFVEWGWSDKQPEEVTTEELKKYKIGK